MDKRKNWESQEFRSERKQNKKNPKVQKRHKEQGYQKQQW